MMQCRMEAPPPDAACAPHILPEEYSPLASQTGGSHVPTRLQDAGEELLTGLEGGSGGDGDARQQAREHRAAIKWGGSDAVSGELVSLSGDGPKKAKQQIWAGRRTSDDFKSTSCPTADLGRTPDVGRLFRITVRLASCPSGESHMKNCGKPNSTGSYSARKI